jgi:hypothetical protein
VRPRNYNYGPVFPLAPLQVHEPEEVRVRVKHECGHEEWVNYEMPPIGFRPAAEFNAEVRKQKRAKKGKKRG